MFEVDLCPPAEILSILQHQHAALSYFFLLRKVLWHPNMPLDEVNWSPSSSYVLLVHEELDVLHTMLDVASPAVVVHDFLYPRDAFITKIR